MRDIFFLAVLPLYIAAILKRPFIGLGMWIWTAMFFPNAWVYGIATSIRYNLLFTGLTVIVYLLYKDKHALRLGSIGWLVLAFFAWTTMSAAMTLAPPEVTWDIWSRLAKIIALFVFILLVVEKKLHFDFFLWCLALSIGFYSGLEGLKFIASGGAHKIEGLYGHVLGDRNELAVAFAMMLPLTFYLMTEFGKRSKIVRIGLLGLITILVIAIIGTQSRGGLLALLAVAGYLFLKSNRKFIFLLLTAVGVSVFISLVPPEWFSRMDTIATMNQDDSFMGRVVAWKLSFILAMHNPFFGGGFKSLEFFPVWREMSLDFFSYSFFYTGDALPNPHQARAAHSIYFQVLGEQGFGGLLLFVSILFASFRKAGKIAKRARALGTKLWISNLASMLQLSIFAYCVGAAALSFAYFDLIYALCGLVVVLDNKFIANVIEPHAAQNQAQGASFKSLK